MRFADVPSAFEILGFGLLSLTAAVVAGAGVPLDSVLVVAAAVGGRPRGLLLLVELLEPPVASVAEDGAGDGVGAGAAAVAAAVLLDPPALEDISLAAIEGIDRRR